MSMNMKHALAFAAFSLASSALAVAETSVEDASPCPTGAVSVYFAPGESFASDESVDLIGRVGEVAAECNAEGVDIVAWIDPSEGQGGMALALERLKLVSERLGDSGLAANRMRVGARVQEGAGHAGPGARNVRIFLRDNDAMTRTDTVPPPPPRARAISPDAI